MDVEERASLFKGSNQVECAYRVLAKDYAGYQSNDSVARGRYLNMGQQEGKLHERCYRGKFGELIVYTHLTLNNKPCTLPNFIKGAHKRLKFEPDLTSGEQRIHVKTVKLKHFLNPDFRSFLINSNDHLFDNWTQYDWFCVVAVHDLDGPEEKYLIVKWVPVGDVIYKGKPLERYPGKIAIPYDLNRLDTE